MLWWLTRIVVYIRINSWLSETKHYTWNPLAYGSTDILFVVDASRRSTRIIFYKLNPMNLYQLITGGLNEVKEEIANEREHRVHLERRITVLERRTTLKWSVLVVLLSLLINSAMVAQKVPQIADNTIVTNFTFSLHDSWLNYILQKVIHLHIYENSSLIIHLLNIVG